MSQKIDQLRKEIAEMTADLEMCFGYSWNDPSIRARISELDRAEKELAEMIENEDREMQMFGATIERIESERPSYVDRLGYAMMILSDVQEMIRCGNDEGARVHINQAKYFIGEERERIQAATDLRSAFS